MTKKVLASRQSLMLITRTVSVRKLSLFFSHSQLETFSRYSGSFCYVNIR